MINRMDKMRRTQLKARKYLESKGWLVWMISHTRWSKDIFSLFDGCALRQSTVALIQVKSGALPSMKPYKLFTETYSGIVCILMCWLDYKGWKIVTIKNGKKEEVKL